MKRKIGLIIALFFVLSLITITLAACGAVEFSVSFVVDGEIYETVSTTGAEIIKMPENPTKEGYTFDGWYWDKDTWERPFTANSLLNEPLSSDMSVHAKWSLTNPPCEHCDKDDNLLCDNCGESYEDGVDIKYTVTFETNGGTTIAPKTVAVIESSPVTTKDYNTFVAWYTDASLQESTRVSFPFTPSEDVTLYAKWSVDFTEGLQMTLQVSSNSYFVTGYTGIESVIVIPETYKGVAVTGINARAFEGNSMITDVIIPDSVTSIGEGAFSGCSSLESITLPFVGGSKSATTASELTLFGYIFGTSSYTGGVATEQYYGSYYYSYKKCYIPQALKSVTITGGNILYGAFYNCTSLTSVTIPDSITSVGPYAFCKCSSLTSVTIGNGVTNIGDYAFESCSKLTSITIPDSVTRIGNYAFRNCTSLTSVTIPDSVTSIGGSAFSGCSSLTSVTIPDSVTSIGENAFEDCSSLTSITIPDSVTSIGSNAFSGCHIETVTMPTNAISSIPKSNLKTVVITSGDGIGSGAFENCTSLTSVTIPNSVTSIGDGAFEYCTSLTSITIPDSVKSIGEGAFSGCSSLESITLPFVGGSRSATASASSLFGYIFGTSSYTGGIATIQYYDSRSYKTYYIPQTLKSVTITGGNVLYSAFRNCTRLSSITIGNGAISIGDYAFEDCSSLTSVTIPDSVISIGHYAFEDCSSLTSVTIPDSVTSIGYGAFNGCSSLESITLPFVGGSKSATTASASTLFGYIFGASSYSGGVATKQYYASGSYETYYIPQTLKSVTITGGNVLYSAFRNCTSLISITIGNGVTSIGDCAFVGCSSLTSVTIGNGVTSIGNYAFEGCSSLTSVTIGNSVTSIGSYAFSRCTSLTSIAIPDSVTSIGSYAFRGCTSLKNVTIPNSVTSIGDYAFEDCKSLTSITIPDSVTNIGNNAFRGCSSLISVTIPDSVTSIGYGAFAYCTSLTSITIPDSVTSIGNYAFYDCDSLTSVTFGENSQLTSIGYDAFYGCSSLTSITIPDSVTSIGEDAFEYCSSLKYNEYDNAYYLGNESNPYVVLVKAKDTSITSCEINENARFIHSSAFSRCTSLTSITIPFVGGSKSATTASESTLFGYIFGTSSYTDGVATKQYYASGSYETYYIPQTLKSVTITGGNILYGSFYNCSGLTSVTIPNGVTSIGNYAFERCSSLTSVTIPDSVTSIGYGAFRNCSSLTSITIPDSVTSIGNSAFYNCSGLTAVYITDIVAWCNIDFADGYANPLWRAKNLYLNGDLVTNLVIPDSVTSIGNYAFYNCTSLTSVTIPDSVTSIGYDAFYGCYSLASVTIPDSITNIGENAFYNCSDLTSVYITDIAKWCNISFSGYSSNPLNYTKNLYLNGELVTELVIPDNVTSIGKYAFYSCSSLTSITIPDSVTRIGDYAFYGCDRLKSVTIGNNVTSIGDDAFYSCSSLTSVYITDIAAWCNISFSGYSSNPLYYAKNLYLNGALVTDIVIPDSVTRIGNYAFRNCTSLTSVTIPDSVTSIGSSAFSWCTSLTSITIPDSVTSIDERAFRYCTSLTSAKIGNSVTSIGDYAFEDCTSLTSVTIPNSVTSIGSGAFEDCYSLTAVYITDIAAWCNIDFADSYANPLWCAKNLYLNGELVTNLVIPDSVTSIGSYAFSGRTSLTSITIPDSVTSIGHKAFSGCYGLTSVTIPDSVTSIGYSAFSGCSSLESITLPFVGGSKSATTASRSTLFGYIFGTLSYTGGVATNQYYSSASGSYETYYIPKTLKSVTITGGNILYGAFYNCSGLASVTIGNGVTSIGNYAFSSCTSLTIYCEAESKPSGWGSHWNYSSCPVVWGYKG